LACSKRLLKSLAQISVEAETRFSTEGIVGPEPNVYVVFGDGDVGVGGGGVLGIVIIVYTVSRAQDHQD
jgi:hypothetical protein